MIRLVFAASLALASPGIAFAQDDPPVNCDSPQSTQEINSCVAEELDKADAELNAVYSKAMASQEQLDRDLAEGGTALVGAAKALKEAQRAWITFRDANCVSKTYIYAGGTIQVAEETSCQKEMTAARAKELKTLIDGDN